MKNVSLGASAADALSIGYRTVLIDDCCRGVDLADIEKTKNTVLNQYGVIVNADQVTSLISSIMSIEGLQPINHLKKYFFIL